MTINEKTCWSNSLFVIITDKVSVELPIVIFAEEGCMICYQIKQQTSHLKFSTEGNYAGNLLDRGKLAHLRCPRCGKVMVLTCMLPVLDKDIPCPSH